MVLHVGDKTNVLPSECKAIDCDKIPIEAVIRYIHPYGRFFSVKFRFGKGTYCESFPLKDIDKSDMLQAGLIAPDPAHDRTMRMSTAHYGN